MSRQNRVVLALLLGGFLLATVQAEAAFDVSDRLVCRAGHPPCVKLVIQNMERRFRRLARHCAHDAVFSLLYLRTTEKFQETLATLGYSDPRSLVREDALFADYYFRAYDAYHRGCGFVPAAWQIAFSAAEQRRVSSAGNALLGMNAHIQRDLPFVLWELEQRGHAVSYADHNRVNQFLAQVEVVAEIVTRFDPTFDDSANASAFLQLIFAWREQAFVNYQRLRSASTAEERETVAADIETSTAAAAAAIAQQTAYPEGASSASRDAYCFAQNHAGR
jgi:hypothetical protein